MSALLGRIAAGVVARASFLTDLLALLVVLAGSALLSGGVSPALPGFAVTALAVWSFVALTLRHYDPWASDRATFDDVAMTSVLVFAVTTMLATATELLAVDGLPHVGLFLLLFWPVAVILRLAVFRTFSERSAPVDEVMIVGTGPLARATADELVRRRRKEVLGYFALSGERVGEGMRGRVLGKAADVEDVLRSMPVGELYISTTSFAAGEEVQQIIKVCERFGVPFALPAQMFRLDRARPASAHRVTDGYIHYDTVLAKPFQLGLKRAIDIVAAGVALWLLGPLLLGVAAAVRLTSPGPVLFRQVRVGLNGRPFRMLKFRTMVQDAEALKASLAAQNEMDGPVFKMKRDPRITPVGRILRKYSIDELPQLINVLRGDMSLVGPRPPVPAEVARYQAWQRRRLSVRPGLTCIWQVSGRNEISFVDWMYMDLQYIDHWSLGQDLALIFKTVPVVLTGRGAS